MSINTALIEEAREFVSKSHVGSVTARELDQAIGLLRKMIDNADRISPRPDAVAIARRIAAENKGLIDRLG